ncbi:MAG TPA: BTAD domain-containing putative transcriptional regulator, partial [Steroidobacteraceae bacterium]|nr:BTAD domain-containing putative transcriptional regulator [Steroidobacteraceae bacterium]
MSDAKVQIQLLGQLSIVRDAAPLSLPASRKVRALLAYLALNERGVTRSMLCDLLWETPNDPRGELRWCLSKIRRVFDESDKIRIETSGDRIALNVSDCFIDAIEIDKLLGPGITQLNAEQLRIACILFRGDFLEGLYIDGNACFNSWLLAQRHRFKANHVAIVERLGGLLPVGSDEYFQCLRTWLQLAPCDRRAHEALLLALAESGRVPDAETHLASAIRQFEVEGVDWLPLREAWRAIRAKCAPSASMSNKQSVPIEANSISIDATKELTTSPRRASVAVMPFVDSSASGAHRGGMADGLVEDIITRLAKL